VESSIAALLDTGGEPRKTAYEAVLTALRDGILSGRLPGGTRLVQAELGSHFGVSNTPVREALRQLATEGLVQFDSYRGAVVSTPTPEDTREVYEVLTLLEPVIAAKAAANITAVQLDELEALHEQMCATEEISEWVPLNRAFHGLLHEAADSARIASIVGGLMDASTVQVATILRAGMVDAERSNAEHGTLLKALRKRDGDRAARTMAKHIEGTLKALNAAG
jgi:DNA-binding GntR family transcriptional regulator